MGQKSRFYWNQNKINHMSTEASSSMWFTINRKGLKNYHLIRTCHRKLLWKRSKVNLIIFCQSSLDTIVLQIATASNQQSMVTVSLPYYVLQVTCSGSYIPCHTFYLQHRNRVGKRALALHYWYKEHWDCTPEQVVLMSLSAQAVNSWRSSSEHILIVI